MLAIDPIRGELVGSRYERPRWAPPVRWHPVWDLPRVPRTLHRADESLTDGRGEPSYPPRSYPPQAAYGTSNSMPGGPPPPYHGGPPGYGGPPGMHMGGPPPGMPPDAYGMGMQGMPPQGMPPDMWHGGPGPMRHGKGGGKGGMGKGGGKGGPYGSGPLGHGPPHGPGPYMGKGGGGKGGSRRGGKGMG